jgi:DNA invertase Pin-like site-specific DNA recombinase
MGNGALPNGPSYRAHPRLYRAREEGTKLGRKPLEETDAAKVKAIRAMRHKGTGIRRIARELGVGVGTVLRVTSSA